MSDGRTNVLFVVSDEERRNDWMEGHVGLPHHERLRRDGTRAADGKGVDVDAAFDEQEHEWYEHGEDRHEMVNLAGDPDRRRELRGLFERLRAQEALHFD